MGITNREGTIDVTDYSKTDPNGLLPQEYKDKGITPNNIIINGMWFDGVSRDSQLGWEEFVWSTEPSRNNMFALENMDTIDVGLVAQCQINFKYFNAEDFKRFREAIKQRHFLCTFFNVDTGEWEYDREMYCSKSERQRLYYFDPKLVGVLDFKVTLVATNNDRVEHEPINIYYEKNNYDIITKTDTVAYSDEYKVEDGPELAGYTFKYWTDKVDENGNSIGFRFKAGQSFTAFKDKHLYPIYE